MSIKDLFNKRNQSQISKAVPINSASVQAESTAMIEAKRKEFDRFIPPINFATASNYAKFGSAELYLENSFKRIYQQYPYDGTLAEKTEFENSSSFLDRYIFDNIYPRTNGYAVFSIQGTGHTAVAGGGGFSRPTVKEYISVQGGPHTASSGMINKDLHDVFDDSMLYDVVSGSKKGSSFEVNTISGSTIEFWMKKGTFVSGNAKQVIFDMWNGMRQQVHDSDYGRLTLMLSRSTNIGDEPFALTLRSGSSGFNNLALGSSQASSSVMDNNWHHYAITIQSSSSPASSLKVKLYIDGDLDSTATSVGNYIPEVPIKTNGLNAYLGALITSSLDNEATRAGDGKLSASLDDFRFWKVARTPEQINLTWNIPIGGGTNKHDSNKDLGVYFKFNEGVTGLSATDAKVLDYSGRIANGFWTGYASGSRRTTSAFVESGKVEREFKDPIIYSFHPDVSASVTEYKASGSLADQSKSSMFYNLFPAWMQETDTEFGSQLKILSQIISSYFDTLWHQIDFVNKIHDKQYITGSSKAFPFAKKLLESRGFMMPDLFIDSKVSEIFLKKNDSHVFEKDIHEIKNLIYQNIYNNLDCIYKSKGTEKSFRNFFRAVGLNSELVKLRMYADDSTYVLRENLRNVSYEKNYLNFNTEFNTGATIFQTSGSTDKRSSFINTGSIEFNKATTLEADIVLPLKNNSPSDQYFASSFLTASVVGYTPADADPDDFAFKVSKKDVHIIIARDVFDSQLPDGNLPTIRFGISSSHDTIGIKYGPRIQNQYNDNKWNLSLTFKDKNYPYGSFVSGSSTTPAEYDVCLYGIETDGTIVKNEFKLETETTASAFVTQRKRVYAGALRTAFTGTIEKQTDIKLGSVRYWRSFLPTGTIAQHAFDPESYGANKVYMPDVLLHTSASIPKSQTLALHWGFNMLTGSDSEGEIKVFDLSSGSAATTGTDNKVIGTRHMGRGYGFLANSTSSVAKEYLFAAKKSQPDDMYSSDLVKIQDESTENFFSDDNVSDNFYSFEKSLYGAISQEMLNTFSSVKDFANLIGQPNQRYHSEYHKLNQLKHIFFEDVENSPDLEKFTRFYKWIDESISKALEQLIPASARFSTSVNNMVESHVLERNKYAHRVGLLTRRESTEGSIKGVSELLYDWERGHAPVGYKPLTNAVGSILITSNPADGDTICISDGTTKIDFEFKNSTTATNHAQRHASNANISAQRLITTINSQTGFNITAKPSPAAGAVLILLKNTSTTPSGNVGITGKLTASAGNEAFGMAGGGFITANQKENCLWWSDRAETPEVGGHASSINTIRDVMNNHSLQSAGLVRRKTDGTVYYGSTYAIRKLAKPYEFTALKRKTIHGGTNFSEPVNKFFMLDAVSTFGAAASAPNHVITVGVGAGTTGIVNKQLCETKEKPSDKFKHSIEAEVGKYAGVNSNVNNYAHNMNGNRIFPFNFVSGTVHSGYNAETKRNYRNDVIITNLHSDITDLTNDIPMQGPFTETHVGGHQSRHVNLNSFNSAKSLLVAPSTGGVNAQAIIRFTSSNNSVVPRDTVVITDFYDTSIAASASSNFDLLNNKWTTAEELKEIIENKLEIDVSIHSYIPGGEFNRIETLTLTMKEPGAGGNGKAVTANTLSGSIQTLNFGSGGSATAGVNPTLGTNRNTFLDTSTDRPEAFGIVMKEHPVLNDADGAFGVVPADYGTTSDGHGTLPFNVHKPKAIRFRDEHAKRPLNIRNILYDKSSATVGNYRKGYELFTLQRGDQKRWYRDASETGLHLPPVLTSSLPETTNYLSLFGPAPFEVGNFFGSGSNRLPDATNLPSETLDHTFFKTVKTIHTPAFFDLRLNSASGSTPQSYMVGYLRITRASNDPYEVYSFRWSTTVTNGNTTVLSAGPGVGSQIQVDVRVIENDWVQSQQNFYDAVNTAYVGNALSASFPDGNSAANSTIRIHENVLLGSAGNGGGTHAITSAWIAAFGTSFAGGTSNRIKRSAKDLVITVPRTDLTSSTHEIVNRFSAPGGPEVNTAGYLDVVANSFSPHNAMPFRNLTVLGDSGENTTIRVTDHLNKRRGLRTLLAVHQGKGGLDSQFLSELTASNYGISGSFVKQHRNTFKVPQYSGDEVIIGSRNDNGYFSSILPRSEFQYSWINKSTANVRNYYTGSVLHLSSSNAVNRQRILGFGPSDGVVSIRASGSEDGGTVLHTAYPIEAIAFPTGSKIFSRQ